MFFFLFVLVLQSINTSFFSAAFAVLIIFYFLFLLSLSLSLSLCIFLNSGSIYRSFIFQLFSPELLLFALSLPLLHTHTHTHTHTRTHTHTHMHTQKNKSQTIDKNKAYTWFKLSFFRSESTPACTQLTKAITTQDRAITFVSKKKNETSYKIVVMFVILAQKFLNLLADA